jgi:hypothetical protein
MLKSVFVSINLLGIFFISMINIGKVEISHVSDPKISIESQTEVTITINKESFSGPGRLKLDFSLADGLTPFELENDGASFTFSNNEALYIWYSIPSNETITIKYLISANKNSLGNKKISGTFSYLDESERKQVSIPDLYIEVVEKPIENNNSVSCTRSIESVEDYFVVRIHTNKQQQKGFARIKDNLPKGFTAQSLETSGAVFKNIDNAAKFLWSELPSSLESFTVSYKLIPPLNNSKNFELNGFLSAEFLITENQSTTIDIPATKYSYESLNNIAQQETELIDTTGNIILDIAETQIIEEEEEEEENNIEQPPVIENIEIEEIKNNDVSVNNNQLETEEKASLEASNAAQTELTNSIKQTTISYKVQLLAAHRIANKKYFKNKHQYSDLFNIENHEGWVKYTTVEFNEYKTARNKREALSKHKFPGPFVTAYNNGERISVQEALMTSKQDWVQ